MFLKLHKAGATDDTWGQPRYVNMDNVVRFKEWGTGTVIHYVAGPAESEEVRETPEEIATMVVNQVILRAQIAGAAKPYGTGEVPCEGP